MGQRGPNMQMYLPFTPMVKKLVIFTTICWLVINLLLDKFVFSGVALNQYLGLIPLEIVFGLKIWQPLTYMFLHSTEILHVLFNMLLLWMIGAELEMRWGAKEFLKYYLVCGVGTGILYSILAFLSAFLFGSKALLSVPVIGASGAVFGLLLAYGILFAERTILFMFIFPMKAKYFVLLIGGVELYNSFASTNSGVSNLAHLCGLVVGFIYLSFWARRRRGGKKKKNKPNLQLIVDNESQNSDTGSKYWN